MIIIHEGSVWSFPQHNWLCDRCWNRYNRQSRLAIRSRQLKVLLLKTSSLGDLLHTLPALTDAVKHLQTLRIDWLAEEAFCQIPQWHPAVHRVIPISLRRWRKHPLQAVGSGEIAAFVRDLRSHSYDAIIDAQGLLKSALPGLLGKGPCYGYDRFSAREPLSALAYTHKVSVARNLHAIERVRRLFAASLGYNAPATQADFGLPGGHRYRQHPYLVFLHGSSWPSKRWPQPCWRLLAEMALAQGFRVLLPWGNEAEQARARELARGQDGVEVLPRMDLNALRDLLSASSGVLGVDSGLVHLAAALSVPTLALYGPTSADLTGTQGRLQKNLQAAYHCVPCGQRQCPRTDAAGYAPCFDSLPPAQIWNELTQLMEQDERP